MEGFWIQLLAILTLLTQTCSPSDTTELIGAVGRSVTFCSNDTNGNAALWSFGDIPIVTVTFEDPPRPVFLKEEYRTRFTVSERGRALTISPLRMEDAGTYSVTIDGKKSTFILLVYGRCFLCFLGVFTLKKEVSDCPLPPGELPEPTVTCEAQDCLDRTCLVSLRCSVPGAGFGNVSYTWRGWGQRWNVGSVVLTVVDKSSLDSVEPLTCTARNAVSRRSVTVTTPEGLCPG
ncbi:SLAF5 protein, partial [Leiothrix lutea]|nr:SLAF5 protein [Leiothrix lutea]